VKDKVAAAVLYFIIFRVEKESLKELKSNNRMSSAAGGNAMKK
jgi:hypothetical protein